MKAMAITGPADLRDQRWLDERIAAIEDGVEAVIDIARNWTDGRNLARLHPGVAAAAYVTDRVGTLGKAIVPVLLAESNWSNVQIAAVAGVSPETVRTTSQKLEVGRPAETLGADGRLRTATPARVPFRPVLAPDANYAPRTVTAVVIDTPRVTPFSLIAQTFERDIRRLLEGYEPHLDEERFTARFGAVVTAIRAALEEGK